ncbi:MAG: hypothetical protein Q7S28_04210 [bacterium]|nr:hypothetical protein [bacterium]
MTLLTKDERAILRRAETFEELRDIAFGSIRRMDMPFGVGMVCGPISTGGLNSIKANLAKFKATIDNLSVAGIPLFSQLPYETAMHRIMQTPYYRKEERHLLDAFYLPIFESRLVRTHYFMPDWATSIGATWEHDQAVRLGIHRVYLIG